MLAQIWEKLKRKLIRKLLTEPHTAFLHNRFSASVVKLEFETEVDAQLFVKFQIVHRVIRLIAMTSFRRSKGEWTEPEGAIFDTGSPVSLIPHNIWTNARYRFISDEVEMGIAGQTVTGRLGWITLRLHDNEMISPPLRIKANLIFDDSLPLILGFEDVLTELIFVGDFRKNIAYIIFWR